MWFVYRCYDANERLLYVGSSTSPLRRIGVDHRYQSHWYKRVKRVDLSGPFRRSSTAAREEGTAIMCEKPKFNVVGRKAFDQKANEKTVNMIYDGNYLDFLESARRRRMMVWKLRARGWSVPRIAKKIGVSRQRIGQILHSEDFSKKVLTKSNGKRR